MARDKENLRKWKEANREHLLAQERERYKIRYAEERDKILEKNKRWRERHAEEIKLRMLQTRDKRLERRRKAYAERGYMVNQVYYQANKEKYSQHLRDYRKENPDRYRLYWNNYRAKAGEPLTESQWEAIKKTYQYRCAYCGCKPKVLTQDHVIAVANGGKTEIGNIVPACRSCNSKKGVKEPNTPLKRLML